MASDLAQKDQVYWIELAPAPVSSYTYPVWYNHHEFVIVPPSGPDQCLYKYNINENVWQKWIEYPGDLDINYHTASINKEQKVLYIHGNKDLIKVDLESTSFKHYDTGNYDGSFTVSTIINNRFHIFGGWNHTKHLKWNDITNEFNEICNICVKWEALNGKAVVDIQSKKTLLLLDCELIYLCDYAKMEWKLLDVTVPKEISNGIFVCCLSGDDRYLILFGSFGNKDIYVMDLNKLIFHKSYVHLPADVASLRCIAADNIIKNEMLVFGFIRDKCDGILLPMDLFMLIASLYCNDYVYILSVATKHWKIKLDDILNGIL